VREGGERAGKKVEKAGVVVLAWKKYAGTVMTWALERSFEKGKTEKKPFEGKRGREKKGAGKKSETKFFASPAENGGAKNLVKKPGGIWEGGCNMISSATLKNRST